MKNEERQFWETLEDLSLLLMYLTRFREDEKDELWQAWKGYDFRIMDTLQGKKYISFSHRAKRVYLQQKGIEKAKQLMRKYKIEC